MEIIDPGHHYKLHTLDGNINQEIIFVKREGEIYPKNIGHHAGTTIQECLRVLIDRVKYLDSQISCISNKLVIYFLRRALEVLEKRADERHNRIYIPHLGNIEMSKYCITCGHVNCPGCAKING